MKLIASVPLIAVAVLSACSGTSPPQGAATDSPLAAASAKLSPTSGSKAAGTVSFAQNGNEVTVTAKVTGLSPGQEHGFHIHEKGECGSDGMKAGGHFNPTGSPHGPQVGTHHAGDLPSLRADANGNADTTFTVKGLSIFSGGADDIVGLTVVVHANPDDYVTQPTGNSGGRIACGLIMKS